MAKQKTKSGFEFELSKERLNNYELFELISEIEENPLVMPQVLKLLLGKEDTKRLKDHVRTEDGFVPVDKIENEITEIFHSHSETKNS